MAKPGRPSELTQERFDDLVALVRANGSVRMAAYLAGIPDGTVKSWVKRGHDDEEQSSIEARFATAVKRASAEWAKSHTDNIAEQSKPWIRTKRKQVMKADGSVEVTEETVMERGQWQGSAWLLERTLPHEYAVKAGGQGEDDDKDDDQTPAELASTLHDMLGGGVRRPEEIDES